MHTASQVGASLSWSLPLSQSSRSQCSTSAVPHYNDNHRMHFTIWGSKSLGISPQAAYHPLELWLCLGCHFLGRMCKYMYLAKICHHYSWIRNNSVHIVWMRTCTYAHLSHCCVSLARPLVSASSPCSLRSCSPAGNTVPQPDGPASSVHPGQHEVPLLCSAPAGSHTHTATGKPPNYMYIREVLLP